MREKELIDLDEREDAIIAVTYEGKVRSLSKSELLRLLAMDGKASSAKGIGSKGSNRESEGRNLNSLGKRIASAYDANKKKKAIPEENCTDLVKFIDEFDGNVGGKRSTQVYHYLVDMKNWSINKELRSKIEGFLKTYPSLGKVPKRE